MKLKGEGGSNLELHVHFFKKSAFVAIELELPSAVECSLVKSSLIVFSVCESRSTRPPNGGSASTASWPGGAAERKDRYAASEDVLPKRWWLNML